MTEQEFNPQDGPEEPQNTSPEGAPKIPPRPGTTEYLRGKLSPTLTPVKAAWLGLFIGAIVYQLAGSALTFAIFGMDFTKANPSALQLLQLASQVLFLLLPALMLSKTIYGDVTTVLRFRMPENKSTILLFLSGLIVLLIWLQDVITLQNLLFNKLLTLIPALKPLQTLLDNLDKMVNESYAVLMKTETFADKLILFFVVAVTPAICEEILFRGYIQTSFELKYSSFVAAVITALFFALFHLNPFGIVALFALGLYMGYASYRSDSIATPMIIHFFNNGFSLLLYFIVGDDDFTGSAAAAQTSFSSVLPRFFLLSALMGGIIYLIEKNTRFSFIERKSN